MNLQADLRIPIRTDVLLSPHSTFRIGGPARYFAEPQIEDDLHSILEFIRKIDCPFFLLGRGSNLLISDLGFDGLMLSMRKFEAKNVVFEGDDCVVAPAGMSLIQLCLATEERGLTGLEFLCHVPGTVGGAVVMNAGFCRPGQPWKEVKDVVESLTIMYPNGTVRNLDCDQIRFEYRSTDISSDAIILRAKFRLKPEHPKAVHEEILANFQYRNSVQDLQYPSAGSTFKNPSGVKLSSGQLLDRAGMKGEREGGAMVSRKHANFIVNVDHASARDVLTLMRVAQKRVFQAFGINLQPEIRYVSNENHE